MARDKSPLYRDAALARLASPEKLDARLQLLGYPRSVLLALAVLLAGTAAFAAWLLTAR
ncbi:hypothetical protein DSM104443_00929 [Usitatibacter rugosus]|uniref:Uncharacterized protein n=1 Tax=Usitatibacter rugosus TaxID=2732067 RepID=A0A6M4GRC1_9PROT|nr:hypothetical protein [Usitatibacter rugosus]QJR09879.1 hypothetical protein DSM104443_00929 [Usitatibacter rugosus]